MEKSLKGRDFISLHDFTADEIRLFLETAQRLKHGQKLGETIQPLKGKTLGMIFTKASTRTRVSFEVGMIQLGAIPVSQRQRSAVAAGRAYRRYGAGA